MAIDEIAKKWQKRWKDADIYKVKENPEKEKFYILDMFPYPSGAGLHVWHPKGYIASDVISRKKILEWFNVLHPMGFDTFGLWTENYAIENKMKPQVAAENNINTFKDQLEKFGFTYDRNREVNTADPKYFKWTQKIFLDLYNHYFDEETQKAKPIAELEKKLEKEWKNKSEIEKILSSKRLAYIDYKPINWCPKCKTGLANEDLDNGKCERCASLVEQKPMRQRVLRITEYAQRLLDWLEGLEWAESMKELQRNWIGKSEWTQFKMEIDWTKENFEVYTTRVDTVFGMSFVAIAPEHELVEKITTSEYKKEVQDYIEKAKHKTQLERTELQKDKTGVFCGAYAINPFNWEKVAIFVADYVLAGYGTWVVMAVPAHDERDFEFAKKYDLKITEVIKSIDGKSDIEEEAFVEKGILVNSWEFDWMKSDQAILEMQKWLSENNMWWKKINFKIQDWVFSRQRYWWEPIPFVFCDDCGLVALEEKDLPLELPDVENYEPTGTEEWPLANIDEWINTSCPKCGWKAKRESNTMPGWAGSSWYWIRYMDPRNDEELVSKNADNYWKNVDVYIWGAEHVTRHMIYARFWQKFLFDLGIVNENEPFKKYQKVGLIMWEDKRKMSKRRGNVVNPDDVISENGSDALRVYEMFMWPFDQSIDWNTSGVKWVKKFLDKFAILFERIEDDFEDSEKTLNILHKTIQKVTTDIDKFGFNTAIAQMMILVNHLCEQEKISKKSFESLIVLISPFAPHLSEEFWEKLGNEFSIFTKSTRPKFEEKYLVTNKVKIAVQFNWKVRWVLEVDAKIGQDEFLELVRSDEKLSRYFVWELKKVIFIPDKICNIVV